MIQLDVCNQDSIASAVDTIKTKHGGLHGLVNNAGGWLSTAKDTVDLNLYAVINVTEAFLPLIDDEGRIVMISSAAGPNYVSKCSEEIQKMFVNKNVTFAEIEKNVVEPFLSVKADTSLSESDMTAALLKKGLNDQAYGVSKAGLNAYTMEKARTHQNILINSCTPGFIETDLTKPFAARSGKTGQEMGMKSTDDGAKAGVYLMMNDLKAEIADYESGRYYGSDAVRSPLHKYRSPGDPPYTGEFP